MRQHEEFLIQLMRHELDLKAFIGSLVRDWHAREDVLHEVVLAMWSQFASFDRGRSFGAWARGIALNKVLQRRRQDVRFPAAFTAEAMAAIARAYDDGDAEADPRRQALEACLEALPEHARQTLSLRYEQRLSVGEVARRLGRSLDAAYQALSRLRASLEECIRRRLASGEKEAP